MGRWHLFREKTKPIKSAIQEYKAADKLETKKEIIKNLENLFREVIQENWIESSNFNRDRCERDLNEARGKIEYFQIWLKTLFLSDSIPLILNIFKAECSLANIVEHLLIDFQNSKMHILTTKLNELFAFTKDIIKLARMNLQINLSLMNFNDEMIAYLQNDQNTEQLGVNDQFIYVLNNYKNLYPTIKAQRICYF